MELQLKIFQFPSKKNWKGPSLSTLQQAKTLWQLKQAYQLQETKHEDGSTNPVHVPGRNDGESEFATIGLDTVQFFYQGIN